MPSLIGPALIGIVWILVCAVWFVLVVRRARGAPEGSLGYPGRYPGLLLNGIALIALTPVVSAVQYVATGHLSFWAGAVGVLPVGIIMVLYQLLIARQSAGQPSRPSATTFREKSIVVQIVSILAVYGYFGVHLWRFWEQPASPPALAITAITAYVGITICLIIIGIVAAVALAIVARAEATDERDRAVEIRGWRNAYGALAAGVWVVLLLVIADVPGGALFYTIMGVFALAELVRLGSQLLYYRLGT